MNVSINSTSATATGGIIGVADNSGKSLGKLINATRSEPIYRIDSNRNRPILINNPERDLN